MVDDGKVSLHIRVRPDAKERLIELKELTGADSIIEVVRRALGTYDVIVRRLKAGGVLVHEHGDESTELVLPEAAQWTDAKNSD
jgi:hypothetical protein